MEQATAQSGSPGVVFSPALGTYFDLPFSPRGPRDQPNTPSVSLIPPYFALP